jgi:hypothetical protein
MDQAYKAQGEEGVKSDEWNSAQLHWDYFYQMNQVLEHKQRKLDLKRAQALRPFLPPRDSSGASAKPQTLDRRPTP